MILDKIENAENYYSLHPLFEQAFKFLERDDIRKLEPTNYELNGKELYASLTKKNGKKKEEAKLEAHRKYIDIQFLIDGNEKIGWKALKDCRVIEQEYNNDKDIEFFSDPYQSDLELTSGTFAIFFPWDAHAPMIFNGEVHKVVVKVKV